MVTISACGVFIRALLENGDATSQSAGRKEKLKSILFTQKEGGHSQRGADQMCPRQTAFCLLVLGQGQEPQPLYSDIYSGRRTSLSKGWENHVGKYLIISKCYLEKKIKRLC